MKAILVPYSIGQNAPSQPLSFLWDVPETEEEQREELTELFFDYVLGVEGERPELKFFGEGMGFGDVAVVEPETDVILFATFIK